MNQKDNQVRIRNQLSQNLFGNNKSQKIDLINKRANFLRKECSLQEEEIDKKKKTTVLQANQIKLGQYELFEQKYYLEETIGQGAHAIVKKAKLISNPSQIFAVKICRSGDPEIISTFIDTYKNVRFLNHPNILKVNEIFIDQETETLYCVMDYSPQKSLEKIMKKQKIISEKKAKQIVKQLLIAIEHMHQMGISHRDLKPDNILVGQKIEELKIIDFGVSKRFIHFVNENHQVTSLSRDMWTRTGNYLYCAPEIFQGGGYNEKVDLWAVGIIFYQLLSGMLPFQSETIFDTIKMITQFQNHLNLNEIQASNLTKDCLKRLLQANPNDRVSAEECLKHPCFYNEEVSIKFDTTSASTSPKNQILSHRSQSINKGGEELEAEELFFKRKHSRSCTYLIMRNLKNHEQMTSNHSVSKLQKKEVLDQVNSARNGSPIMKFTKMKEQINLEIHIHKIEEDHTKSFQLRKMINIYD